MNTPEFQPKGWHSAVRAIVNGLYDASEALRRNNPGTSNQLRYVWLTRALLRATQKYEVIRKIQEKE